MFLPCGGLRRTLPRRVDMPVLSTVVGIQPYSHYHREAWRLHSSGISPMDCKSSRHVSEQLSSPPCSAQPSGRGAPQRTWVCRLHCPQRMVTSGVCSGMAALLLVSAWAAAPCRTTKASGASSASSLMGVSYHNSPHAVPRCPEASGLKAICHPVAGFLVVVQISYFTF
jgi:hypothetical protein